jgi:Mn-dependent DtxR family transcriptional regulator
MEKDDEKLAWRLLETMYQMARADVAATPQTLGTWLDVPGARVQELLRRLDAQGLVDRTRCRLTMPGLVLAVSMDGACKLARHLAAA